MDKLYMSKNSVSVYCQQYFTLISPKCLGINRTVFIMEQILCIFKININPSYALKPTET